MPTLHDLRWHTLTYALRPQPTAARVRSKHVLEVAQALVKGIAERAGVGQACRIWFRVPGQRWDWMAFDPESQFTIDVFFTGANPEYAQQWREAALRYFEPGEPGHNFENPQAGPVRLRTLAELLPAASTGNEACLDFLTPVPFERASGREREWIDAAGLLRLLERRVAKLFGVPDVAPPLAAPAFTALPLYLGYRERAHDSRSNGGQKYLNGCVGPLYVKGDLSAVWPWLVLCAELNLGEDIGWGLGHYRLLQPGPAWFAKDLFDVDRMRNAVEELLERSDDVVEGLAREGGLPVDETQLSEELVDRLGRPDYSPAPYAAFNVPKRTGGMRRVEKPSVGDLIIQHHILKLINPVLDRSLPPESIGYRKNYSRDSALGLLRQAIAEGYGNVLESDIADFYPSADPVTLLSRLDQLLPAEDVELRRVLEAVIHAPFRTGSELHERARGLAEGSPLSNLFANLYLATLDEAVRTMDVRYVRYSDDFVILFKDKAEGEALLQSVERVLAAIGLHLKPEKTALHSVRDGFTFLGINFGGGEFPDVVQESRAPSHKPLYLTEQHLFLSLNHEALDVRRGGELLHTVPLHRVSEIIVLGSTLFSTALVRKCARMRIPLAFTLESGYRVATLHPESQAWFRIAARQSATFEGMTDADKLVVARRFASGKIRNFHAFYRQRYEKGRNKLLEQFELDIAAIETAATVDVVRGQEADAAKRAFAALNSVIEVPGFEFRVRQKHGERPDRLNSLLNFGYSLLASRVHTTVRVIGLNPFLGFLHESQATYESLVWDLVELFRAHVDRLVVRVINLKVVKEGDFVETDQGFRLQKEGIAAFIGQFEREMDRRPAHHRPTLGQAIHAQSEIVRDFMTEGTPLSIYTWED